MFYQILLSPQAKRWAIIIYQDGIYELAPEFLNNLRVKILGNKEVSQKCLNFIEC